MTQTRSPRPTQLALSLIAAALTLLALAPSAFAFQTRTPLGTFGLAGAGTCPDLALATGIGDLDAATATGDTSIFAQGTGDLIFSGIGEGNVQPGSFTVTNLNIQSGAFTVGEPISTPGGGGIPAGTTITAAGAGTLTLSQAYVGTGGRENLISRSKTISNVTTTSGTFKVGESISGNGIQPATTITAVGANTLTLSSLITSEGHINLISGSKTISNVTTTSGTFKVGESISGDGIQPATTITAIGANTLTLSAGVTEPRTGVKLTAGSVEVTSVTTDCGTFVVGQTIEGVGIRNGTTITAVGPDTLTLSAGATELGAGVQLSARSSFREAKRLAFNQANDKLYALDAPFSTLGPKSIHAFDVPDLTPAGGAFPLAADEKTAGIAVDNTPGSSANNIYYVNRTSFGEVIGLDSAGAPLGGKFPVSDPTSGHTLCGAAVDSTGKLWVTDASQLQSIFKYDSAGNKLGQLPIPQGAPCALAFDSNDDVYISIEDGFPGVWKYTAASGYKTATQVVKGSIRDIAVDRSTHILYAVLQGATGATVAAYDPSGTQLYGFGIAGRKAEAQGVTVDESADRVYVAEDDRVRVYGALAEFPDATATPQPATDVRATKVELHATIDDNSALPTRWFFQLSKDGGATWIDSCPRGPYGEATEGGQSGRAVSCEAILLQSNTDYLFRVVTGKGAGSTDVVSSALSFKTDLIPPASATLDPAANVTADTADLSATIDDNGPLGTAWRFEVSTDNGVTWSKPAGDVSGETGGGESGVAVSGTAEELDPNTEYRFRIVTKKDPGAPDEPSLALSFLTLTAPPKVENVGAVQITDTSASLVGEVHPRNLQTSYHFEYGPTPALGTSTPSVELGGNKLLIVSQEVPGLTTDSDYYFKLVAVNAAGTSDSSIAKLHTRSVPLPLPDDRAYEQVTPPDKNFGNAGGVGATAVGWDGQGVAFGMFTGFGEPAGQITFIFTDYLSRRGPGGWHTHWLGEPLCPDFGLTTEVGGLSPNLDRAVIVHPELDSCSIPPLDPTAPSSNDHRYRGDYTTDPPTYRLLNPQGPVGIEGGSEDFSHLVLSSSDQLTPDAPVGDFAKLYDWHEGDLSLISKDTANAPLATASAIGAIGGFPYAVSASASRIFFKNGGEIYMRQNNTTTYDVSQSECISACGTSSPDSFIQANPAGNKALLTSAAKLTNEDTSSAGEDLYLYTHSANPAANANLTLLTKDNEPADGSAPDFLGVAGMSEDGDTVYFAAKGQLVAGQPTAVGPKLYRWQRNGASPTLEYLATLDAEDSSQWNGERTSPDGAYLLIRTKVRLNPGADHDTDRDVFRWDAQNGWLCISCQAPGVPSAGNAATPTIVGVAGGSGGPGAMMSDGGQRIFFSVRDSLVPADTNSGVGDVYEWHDGTISLISTGTGIQNSELFGASRSGDDVFFTATEPLVGWDIDENNDIYDARIGGGFPEPPPTGASCEGEACRGPGTVVPPSTGAGSAAFEGPGNMTKAQKSCPKGKSRRSGRCVSKKQHKKHQSKKHKRAAKHNRRDAR